MARLLGPPFFQSMALIACLRVSNLFWHGICLVIIQDVRFLVVTGGKKVAFPMHVCKRRKEEGGACTHS